MNGVLALSAMGVDADLIEENRFLCKHISKDNETKTQIHWSIINE